MSYVKTTWVDEVLAGAERYDIKENGGAAFKADMQVVLATAVTTPATPVDASNLNKLEQGVYDAHAAIALLSRRIITIALNGSTALTTSDRAKFRVPLGMNGWSLVSVAFNLGTDGSAGASSSGSVTFSVQKGTTDMLSTNPTATASNYEPTTPAVIKSDGSEVVATNNIINVETVASGTGVTYAIVTLEFQMP